MEINSAILLAGGKGTRLGKFSTISNKHLHPVGEKLVLDYSIHTAKSMGIKNLTVVLGGNFFDKIVSVLKDGSDYGLNINYVYQREASGIAQAINLCKEYVRDEIFGVVLGDNAFQKPIKFQDTKNAQIVLNQSSYLDLHNFGVVSIYNGMVMSFEEKPKLLASGMDNYAITGAYIFNQKYFDYFKNLSPSKRNEYEIVDIIKQYQTNNELSYNIQDGWWSDLGSPSSISQVLDLNKIHPMEVNENINNR
jgi:glucose-1-phosphate thymidylyltransferase